MDPEELLDCTHKLWILRNLQTVELSMDLENLQLLHTKYEPSNLQTTYAKYGLWEIYSSSHSSDPEEFSDYSQYLRTPGKKRSIQVHTNYKSYKGILQTVYTKCGLFWECIVCSLLGWNRAKPEHMRKVYSTHAGKVILVCMSSILQVPDKTNNSLMHEK